MEQITLAQTARKHWRSFWPGWACPVLLYFMIWFGNHIGHPFVFFALWGLIFFASYFYGIGVWLRQEAPPWHIIFWSALTPFIIWNLTCVIGIYVKKMIGHA